MDQAGGGNPATPEGITVTGRKTSRRAVLAAALGNATEWYDFGVYSYLAGTIGAVFYPSQTEATELIATFTTFAAAFLVRPLGGIFFGPLGDRIGRKRVLAITMIMMALGTSAIGLIPGHATIGIAAPLLLLAARMMQGFSTGGEYGGATTFIGEYAPDRKRGFLASWLEFGTVSGYIGGALIVTALEVAIGADALMEWGWRIPFLLALPLGLVGLYIRLRLEETPAFTTEQADRRSREAARPSLGTQLRATLVEQWRPLLLCVGVVLAFNVNNYTVTAYLPTYLTKELGYGDTFGLTVSLLAMGVMLVLVTQFGRLSDRVGRRPVLMSGSICSIVLALPAFWLLQRGTDAAVLLGAVLLAVTLVHFSGTAPSTLPALFPTRVRYGAMAISFNVSVALFGGTTPLAAEYLVQATGSLYMPAVLVIVAGVVGVVTVLSMRESAGRPLPETRPAAATHEEARDMAASRD